LHISAQS